MGKKGKDRKKGKGAEKTALKTEKKLSNKQKKELAALGEDDIENILANIEKDEQKRQKVTETVVEPPSRRVNFSLVAHPDKEELILFGGEFFNGQKTFVYNDLFLYNIVHNQWTLVKAPMGPPPRCGHQMVATSSGKGQLWLFGGEFASQTQSQFYHHRDLWVYHLFTKKWEKITAPGGPSARSGHRMVYCRKQLFVFGGFHDNLRDYKYFNDVHVFNLETYAWTKLDVTGAGPAPRSGCGMVALNDGRILVYGGYSKERIKKDVDKGRVYSDMFVLMADKNDTTGLKYKWLPTKCTGVHFNPRCAMTMTLAPNSSAYCFGGVFDVEDDEEDISGTFFNDMYTLDVEKMAWRQLTLSGKRERARKPKCRDEDDLQVDAAEEMDEEPTALATTVSEDGVFTVKVGPAPSSSSVQCSSVVVDGPRLFQPSPRMNCGLTVKHGVLYLYGGMYEDGSKQLTYSDFYALDLKKLEEWKIIQADDLANQEWLGSDSESDDESEEDSEDAAMDTE
ncbi:uncharacterized protein CBL_11145 [Carabus blaptoides fortunei]